MDKKLNQNLVTKILERIPQNVKPVNYIMDVLDLSTESIYRRMRSDICFTFAEAAKLASILDFSIDEVTEQDNMTKYAFAESPMNTIASPSETFMEMLRQYSDLVQKRLFAEKNDTSLALNHVPPIFAIYFDNIFKFFYYKWLHQVHEASVNYHFSEVQIPQQILDLQKELIFHTQKVNGITFYIIDKNIFLTLIKEVHYYYRRKLISCEDLLLIKEDIINLIDRVKKLTQDGSSSDEIKRYVYLSSLNIQTNSCHVRYDKESISYFWLYSINPLVTRDHQLCSLHERWIKSLKKYSTFITQSNELLQAEFFDKQQEYVDTLLAV